MGSIPFGPSFGPPLNPSLCPCLSRLGACLGPLPGSLLSVSPSRLPPISPPPPHTRIPIDPPLSSSFCPPSVPHPVPDSVFPSIPNPAPHSPLRFPSAPFGPTRSPSAPLALTRPSPSPHPPPRKNNNRANHAITDDAADVAVAAVDMVFSFLSPQLFLSVSIWRCAVCRAAIVSKALCCLRRHNSFFSLLGAVLFVSSYIFLSSWR